ncbi:potassium transporter Kup [Phycicoccus sp.]|uniref:potassium transporter Kup n=1 Tax=Phycicoccus sp. TaxID=1902410 RepID=UPI002B52ADF6|nr:potassium transporter Kup [Phycicoccus sp.]HMM96098.1 potassium transporter Kup [Phycicoccus sp.]
MHAPQTAGPSTAKRALVLGALGVVFGDIGTSPLYAMQTVFSLDDGIVEPTRDNALGVVSTVVWAITLVVSVKYVLFVLRADNDGEGGVLSLAFLARRSVRPGGKRFRLVMVLGVIGAALFYGDSLITPAISVMSAIEGLEVVEPGLQQWVVPLGVAVITALFVVQRHGTDRVGRFFGPVMVVWFLTLAALGLPHVLAYPQALLALSPHLAVQFALAHPLVSFLALGAVVLAITGAEALYADMGHFGRPAIATGWFWLVFPSLTLNYLGQAELVVKDPATIDRPFFHLAPGWATLPLVVLATAATVIASQAVISGAFSVSRQAERLDFLPRLTVRQTSEHEGGQIYVPAVNWALFAGVLVLMVAFRSSEHLAVAYGLAVTATLALTTCLFLVYADAALGWGRWRLWSFGAVFLWVELSFVAANATKVTHGGWLPVLMATLIAFVMLTWSKGQRLVKARRYKVERPLAEFLDDAHSEELHRVPGTAVFLHTSDDTTPLSLRENIDFNRVLHRNVIITNTVRMNVPHVPDEERVVVDDLGDQWDGICLVRLHFGFADEQDIPAALALAAQGPDLAFDPDTALYFLSRVSVHASPRPGMARWRKHVYVAMSHNAADPTQYFHLPIARTVVVGAQLHF